MRGEARVESKTMPDLFQQCEVRINELIVRVRSRGGRRGRVRMGGERSRTSLLASFEGRALAVDDEPGGPQYWVSAGCGRGANTERVSTPKWFNI